MKKYAIIVAGGAGVRMGASVPKQFLPLNGRPVLWHTLQAFLAAYEDMEVIVVVPAEHMQTAAELVGGLAEAGRIRLAGGGNTRFHSVRNGLGLAKEAGIIFVHDGVRCLVSPALVRRCYEQAVRVGSAVPVVDCSDSVRLLGEEGGSKPIDRSRIRLVQTPQTFRSAMLLEAYAQDHREAFTDEATVVEEAGHAVCLIDGEVSNMKITTPADLAIAGQLLAERERRGKG